MQLFVPTAVFWTKLNRSLTVCCILNTQACLRNDMVFSDCGHQQYITGRVVNKLHSQCSKSLPYSTALLDKRTEREPKFRKMFL